MSEWGHNLYGGGDQCVGEVGSGGWAGSSWHAKDCICLILSRIIVRSTQRKFPDCMPEGWRQRLVLSEPRSRSLTYLLHGSLASNLFFFVIFCFRAAREG